MMSKCKTNNIFDDVEIQEVVKDRSSILADHHRMYEDVEILLDITHIPYIRTERGICFLTGLVLRLDDCWNYVYKRCGEAPTVEYFAKAVEEYKQYMEEHKEDNNNEE